MSDCRDARSRWVRWGKRVGIPVGLTLLVLGSFWAGGFSLAPLTPTPNWPTRLIEVNPLSAATPVAAADTGLPPETRVIGVEFAGRSRAYLTAVMSDSLSHVMNDRIAGRLVTVAYCDRTDCARAYTTGEGQEAIDLAVGGWLNEDGVKDLLVRHGRYRYELKTGRPIDPDAPPFPFETVEVELTTWGAWRKAHPDTDVVSAFRSARAPQ